MLTQGEAALGFSYTSDVSSAKAAAVLLSSMY